MKTVHTWHIDGKCKQRLEEICRRSGMNKEKKFLGLPLFVDTYRGEGQEAVIQDTATGTCVTLESEGRSPVAERIESYLNLSKAAYARIITLKDKYKPQLSF